MTQSFRVWFLGGLFVSGMIVHSASAQSALPNAAADMNAPAAASAKANALDKKNNWKLAVSKEAGWQVAIAAKDAPLDALANELSQQLGVPVRLSPVMQKQLVSLELDNASVTNVLQALAPQVYLDEVVDLSGNTTNQLLGAYLAGMNETLPARNLHLKEQSETVLFLGTIGDEATEKEKAEPPLQVQIENGLISVRAKQQSVAVVLYEIAQQLGVPFELQSESDKLIDLDLQGYRLEDVLRQLGAPVKLTRRLHVSQQHSEPLRIILLAQPAN